MKKIIFALLGLVFMCGTARAQWVTFDPSNLTQGIVNATKNIMQTSTTATNMINNFKETVKIYEQGKKYYDALKSVNNLVRDARKVREIYLMVGDITDMYVNNFQKMLADPYFAVEELNAMARGYSILLEQASHLVGDLKDIINPSTLSLTDKDRMDVIDRVYNDLSKFRNLTNYFTRKNISVSIVRAKDANDVQRVLDLYGTPKERYW